MTSNSLNDSPILSVILIVADQRERARSALESVLRQRLIDQIEVILFDRSKPGTESVPGANHPNVREIRVKTGITPGWVRAEGVRQARAPLVVFLEEHCIAFPGWADAIIRGFQDPSAAVGPEMHNGNATGGINRFLGILYYPLFLAPAIVEPNLIPHHNAAYRRDVLLGYGKRLEELIFPEDWLQLQMIADGHRLSLVPDMKVLHMFETSFQRSIQFNFIAGQSFEAACNIFYERSVGDRLVRCCALLASPLLRPLKQFFFILKRRRKWTWRFLEGLPIIVSLHAAHALGGIVGVLCGMDRQLSVRFLETQINWRRALPDQNLSF